MRLALQCSCFDKFIIAGNGAYKNYIRKVALEKNKILYLEWRKDLTPLYKQCKFLIHIPDYDPHPCVPMEAALAGCFPIISEGTGLGYLFDDIFIVKDPENFNDIRKKICYINKRPKEAKKLLAEAIKKFPRKEESLRNFQKIFNEILIKLK